MRFERARFAMMRFLARDFSLPRNRLPFSSVLGISVTGGIRPKLMFMGWKLFKPPEKSELRWPPVM